MAHGFGQRYDLPLPLDLWLLGAGASIVLSFVAVSGFRRGTFARKPTANRDLLAHPWLGWLSSRPVVLLLRSGTLGLWSLAIAAGLFGSQDPYANIAPTLIWVVGWVGVSFASIFFGDVWTTFHPLRSLIDAIDAVARRFTGRPATLSWSLPRRTGVWPGLILFAVFAWLELVWSASDVPYALGRALALYSLITLLGMFAFGASRWLDHGEFFSIAFGVLARFAPFELRPTTDHSGRAWRLRPPGIALLEGLPLSLSRMLFIVLMLSTVTFDGFLETQQWLDLADQLSIAGWMQPVLAASRAWGFSDNETIASIGFFSVPMLFAGALIGAAWFARRAAIGPGGASSADVASSRQIACSLVATLVPIAIAYHLAHYLSMLMVSGQYLIPLASDPFGYGWDLFGSASYRVDIGIIGVRFVWYSAAIAIVSGHVASVVLAHVLAERDFNGRRAVIWSQIPFLALMIGYTMLSLWILAQPIVE